MPVMPVGIVTGASRGLGLALARALDERGWRLVVDARGVEALLEATAGLSGVTAIAGDVAAFLDAVDLDAAVLVGSSSAADTARRFALEHPTRALGLVLVGAFHTFPADAPAVRELREQIAALTNPVDPDFVRDFVAGTAGDAVPPGFLETMVAESRRVPAHVWREMLEGLLAAPPAAGSIDTPTLILWGDADPICSREEQDALLAAIPSAELRSYPGVGHLVHWEEPERVAADVAEFAERR